MLDIETIKTEAEAAVAITQCQGIRYACPHCTFEVSPQDALALIKETERAQADLVYWKGFAEGLNRTHLDDEAVMRVQQGELSRANIKVLDIKAKAAKLQSIIDSFHSRYCAARIRVEGKCLCD